MTCDNITCSIFIICQNKDRPCPANTSRTRIIHNGYRTMALQEQKIRMDSIDFNGDFG